MVPREITDDMMVRFRRQITAGNSAGLSDSEIRTGLAAVFAGHVWPVLPTTIDEDGWSREDPQPAMADAAERPVQISDAQWRATAAGIIADQTQPSDAHYLIRQAIPLAEWIKTGEVPK